MWYSHIRMLGIVTILIMLVTECKCQDERCMGSISLDYQSTQPAYIAIYIAGSTQDYADHLGVNDASDIYDFNTTPDTLVTVAGRRITAVHKQVRLKNGWSDIGKASAITQTYHLSEYIECPKSPGVGPYFDSYTIDSIAYKNCTTPPTRLHLVMSSIADFSPGAYLRYGATRQYDAVKAKTWSIDSLYDSQGQDLRASSNWACFADNIYTFLNTGEVEYYQNDILCTDEPDNEGKPYYFAYTVAAENPDDHDNPGEITLTVHVGGWVDDLEDVVFTIEKSNFNRISGTVDKDGETAQFVIKPQ
ncbi:MAG: hypothetical protein HWD92_11540 [Flavobacteriia bacterium]|nr:hypothetical protein [Flavobacteriia bacterium]